MRFSKKIAAISIVAASALAAGAAFAYWTTTGAGDGTAAAAASNGELTLVASFPDGIVPGGDEVVSFTAENPGATDLRLGTITLEDVIATDDLDVVIPGCDTDDFDMAPVVANQTILGDTVGPQDVTAEGLLTYANDAVNNQDDCKSANIQLVISSN